MQKGRAERPGSAAEESSGLWACIVGFGCSLGFFLSILYGAGDQAAAIAGVELARMRPFCVLIAMVASFAVVLSLSPGKRMRALSVPVLAVICVLPPCGAVLLCLVQAGPLGIALNGVACGVPAALLLCAWGRLLGAHRIEQSVPEVFLASALGAVAVFVVCEALPDACQFVCSALPAASVALMRVGMGNKGGDASGKAGVLGARVNGVEGAMSDSALRLSGRIMCGTGAFGCAAGLMEAFGTASGNAQDGQLTFALLLFAIFCLAAIQLFGEAPLSSLRAILPRSDEPSRDDGPLDGAYRLALLLLLTGFLLVPVLPSAGMPGETVVIAGYLGIVAVLAALYLVMGRLGGADASQVFARGFSILLAGETVGIVVGNAVAEASFDAATGVVLAIAGIMAAYAFLFLFTGRDLRSLSVAVEASDGFDRACERIAQTFALSRREAEILPLALRGRTSERIATEFFISKNTVDTHLRRIYAKCGVSSRQELIDLGEKTQKAR